MKKIVLALIAVLFLAVTTAHAAELKDVPKSSWAYEAIKKMVDKGYMSEYDDGTFRGSEALSREVFAAAFAKLLDQIEKGQIKAGASEIKDIKKLMETLNSNVSDYDTRMATLENRLKDLESGKVVTANDLSKVTVELRDKYAELSEQNEMLKKNLASLEQELGLTQRTLADETKKRKSAVSTLWVGVVAAVAAGLASN